MSPPGATLLQIDLDEGRLPSRNHSENDPPQNPQDITTRLAGLEAAYQNTSGALRDAEARIRYLETSYSQAQADALLLTRRVDRLSAALGEKDVVIGELGRTIEQVLHAFQEEVGRQREFNERSEENVELTMTGLGEAQRGVMGLAEGMFNQEERFRNLGEVANAFGGSGEYSETRNPNHG